MADQIEVKPKTVVSAADVPGLDLVPTFANRFNITLNQTFGRLTFGEFVAGDLNVDTNYHTAIVVPTVDLLGLATLIFQVHAQNTADNSAARQAPPPNPGRENDKQ